MTGKNGNIVVKIGGNEVNHGYTCLGVVCMAVADLLLATRKSRMHHFFPPSFFITLSNSLNA